MRGRRITAAGPSLTEFCLRALMISGLTVSIMASAGCRFVEELLHMQSPVIIGHAPKDGSAHPEAVSEVRITFSTAMDAPSVERAFRTFDSSGVSVPGNFSWEGDTLAYAFLVPITGHARVTAAVDTEAEDLYGNSLPEPYRFSFTVGDPETVFAVKTSVPADGAEDVPPDSIFTLRFSRPVDGESFIGAFSLYPPSSGYYSLQEDGCTVSFVPREPLLSGCTYTLRIESSCSCAGGGLQLSYPFQISFTTADGEQPACGACTLLPAASADGYVLNPAPALNTGVEKDPRFLLSFSPPVPLEMRRSAFRFSPPVSSHETWNESGDECIVEPAGPLVYGSVYELEILGSRFRFFVDGPDSVPPSVEFLACCPDSAAGMPPVPVELNDYLHFADADSGFFDFHILHGENSTVDTASFFESLYFRITNGCVTITTTDFEINPSDPPPLTGTPPGPGTVETIYRVYFRPTDRGLPGTVTVALACSLKDTLGNLLSEDFSVTVNH